MDGAAASSGQRPLPAAARQEDVGATQPKAKAQRRPQGRILNRPTIDLDSTIEAAKQAARDAAKALTLARSEARANRKRRTRLLSKAATLSAEDLERIAVLKRTGRDAPTETKEKQTEEKQNEEKQTETEDKQTKARMAKKQRTSGDEAGAGEEQDQRGEEEDEAEGGDDEEE